MPGYYWIRNYFFLDTASVHTNPQLFESALHSGNFWIRYVSGNVWTLNPDIFLSTDVIKSSPVLYREYLRRSEKKKKCLFKKYLDTCGRANSIWIWIRVDVEIFASGRKKLIFKINFKFQNSSFLYPTALPGKIHVVTRSIDTVGKSLTKLSMRYLFRWWIIFSRLRPTAEDVSAFGQHRNFPPQARKLSSGTQGSERPRETNIVDLPGVNLKKTFTRVSVAIVLRL